MKFTREYDADRQPVVAVLSLGEAYAAAGTTECACKIEVTGLSEPFK